jgi:ADP-ribose pyrophosphatase YjhB (NUDIX family)
VKTGIEGVELQQLQVFDAPQRHDRGWVMSVAYLAVAPWTVVRPSTLVVRIAQSFDHDQIVERALLTTRQNHKARPIRTASSPSHSQSANSTTHTRGHGLHRCLTHRQLHRLVPVNLAVRATSGASRRASCGSMSFSAARTPSPLSTEPSEHASPLS